MDDNTFKLLLILGPLLVAALQAYIAVLALRVKRQTNTIAADVLRVEKATNSHSDKLIELSRIAGDATGKQEERIENLAREKERGLK